MCFFFNDTATTEIYTLSLHDALPISAGVTVSLTTDYLKAVEEGDWVEAHTEVEKAGETLAFAEDRKSTRLNSSHANISYAVFCLKKKQCNPLLSPRSTRLSRCSSTTS